MTEKLSGFIRLSALALVLIFCISCRGDADIISDEDIETLKSLPKLNDKVTIKTKFTKDLLPELNKKTSWIKIPNWLAGKWKADNYTVLEFKDQTGSRESVMRNYPCVYEQIYGHQKDDSGNIWHFTSTPYIDPIQSTGETKSEQITWTTPVTVKEDEVIFETTATKIDINKESGLIFDLIKLISRQSTIPVENEHLVTVTDQRGVSTIGGKFHRKHRMKLDRVGPFAPVAEVNGVKLEESFKAFMSSKKDSN